VSESTLVNAQAEALEALGIKPYLINQSRSKTRAFTTPGVSDMLFCTGGRIIFNEVKLSYNVPSAPQLEFQNDVLKGHGIYVVTHSVDELLFACENLDILRVS
jgi:hypothetical protein